MKIVGKVCSGFGKAQNFVKIYSKELLLATQEEIFAGTLNIRVDEVIDWPTFSGRLVTKEGQGDITLYPAIIHNDYKVWVVRAKRTSHDKQIIEIIAKDNLREKFMLSDGNELELEL